MAVQTIHNPKEQAVNVAVAPGQTIAFDFPLDTANFERTGSDLTISLEDGGQVVLNNFFVADDAGGLPPLQLAAGTQVNSGDFLSAFDLDVTPAAGNVPSSGVNAYDDGSGSLIDGLALSDSLGNFQWGYDYNVDREYTGVAATGGEDIPPPPEEETIPVLRAVLYEPNPGNYNSTTDQLTFNVNFQGKGSADVQFGSSSLNGYINPVTDLDYVGGKWVLKVSPEGLAAMRDSGKENVYDEITVVVDGVEYTIQVVLNQDGKYESTKIDDILNEPGQTTIGEWHTQNGFTTDEIISHSSTGSGPNGVIPGDEHWFRGLQAKGTINNVIKTYEGDTDPNTGGKDVIHIADSVTARGPGASNTVTTELGDGNRIDLSGNVFVAGGAKNTLTSNTIDVTANSGDGAVTSHGGINTLYASKDINVTMTEPVDVEYTRGVQADDFGGGAAGAQNILTADGNINIKATTAGDDVSATGVIAESDGAKNTLTAGGVIKVTAENSIDISNATGGFEVARNAYGLQTTAAGALNELTAGGVDITVSTTTAEEAVGLASVGGTNTVTASGADGINIDVNNTMSGAVGMFAGHSRTKHYTNDFAAKNELIAENGDVAINLTGATLIGMHAQNLIQGAGPGDHPYGNFITAAGTVSIDASNGGEGAMRAYGMEASDNGYNQITADTVNINTFGKIGSYGMAAMAQNQPGSVSTNVINAITVTITAAHGTFDGFAMYADKTGVNLITLNSDADHKGSVTLTGDIHADAGGSNSVIGGAGDDTFTIDGAVTGAFIINGGIGGTDTLILKSDSWADFDTGYSTWLSESSSIVNIDSITVEVGSLSSSEYSQLQTLMSPYGSIVDYVVSESFTFDNGTVLDNLGADYISGGLGEQSINIGGLDDVGGNHAYSLSELAASIQGFEHIDMTSSTTNTLTIDSLLGLGIDSKLDAAKLTGDDIAGLLDGTALRVTGDATDQVHLGSDWNPTSAGTVIYEGYSYEVYTNSQDDSQYLLLQVGLL